MADSVDEIKKQVQERVEAEAATLPPKPEEDQKITSKLINECLYANELGDGVLYATLFRDQFVYCKNFQEWFAWDGHHWKRDVMNKSLAAVEKVVECYMGEYQRVSKEIVDATAKSLGTPEDSERIKKLQGRQNALLKRISQLRADKRRTSCLKFAHTIENPIAIIGDEFDQRPMLFPCANGVIDLETGRIKPGRPDDYLSLASPIEWKGIDEPAPLWEKSLLEIFGGNEDVFHYINRLFGYSITGRTEEKVFPVLYGRTGWNGRSMLVETINYIMGDMAGSIASEMLLASKQLRSTSGPSPDIIALKGKRMVFASEIDEGQKFANGIIKKLTGNDEITGRSPHDKYATSFQQTQKLFLMTNTQPSAPAHDTAFWERIHLIPFKISFVNRDPRESHERRAILGLDRQLRREASGILAWMVKGCLRWQKDGLMPPKEVLEATEQYHRNEDMMGDFIEECCIREPGAKEKSSILYNRFVEWYHENIGEKEPSGTWFGKQLSLKYDKGKSNGSNVYHGIALASAQGQLAQ
jgi:putative DNA primase/helicase